MSAKPECRCNYHLGMGPNLLCPEHGKRSDLGRRIETLQDEAKENETQILEDMKTTRILRAEVDDLKARILLAQRLIRHNLPGFLNDALEGNDLSEFKMYANTTLLEHLDDCDKSEDKLGE